MHISTADAINSWLRQGFEHHQKGDLTHALSFYAHVLEIAPTHPDALCLSGIVEFARGNKDKGLKLAKRSTELHPGFVTGHIELAKMLDAAGQIGEALDAYGKAFQAVGFIKKTGTPSEILNEIIALIAKQNSDTWIEGSSHLVHYGQLYSQLSASPIPPPDLLCSAKDSLDITSGNNKEAILKVDTLLDLFRFKKTTSPIWISAVFEGLALPWMQEALACQRYDLALKLESRVYEVYVKQTETEAHFRESFARWLPAMREAGHVAAKSLPAIEWPQDQGKPVVCFFLHNASMLAHVEVMLSVIENLPQGSERPFMPHVYIFDGEDPELTSRLRLLAIPYTLAGKEYPTDDNWWERLLWCRQRMTDGKVTALVWVSYALMMPLAFSVHMAPVQIWWSLKYHGLEFPEIDGYLASQSLAAHKEIDGRLWRAGRLYIKDAYDPSLAPEATKIRQEYPANSIILGCLGREEKLNSEQFLDSVVATLKKHPEAVFLWTGRIQLSVIQDRFEQANVAARCHFIGWVDVRLYAQVLDIFLDSFPFPNGYTAMYTMAAGKPVVFYNSKESFETGIPGLILPVLRGKAGTLLEQEEMRTILHDQSGEDLFFCADTPEEFQFYVSQLISKPNLKEKIGAAMRKVVERYLSDPRATAQSHADHILDIIAEKAGRGI